MLNHPKPNQTTRSHKLHENLTGKRSAGNPHAAFCGGAASGNWGGLSDRSGRCLETSQESKVYD